MTRHTLFSVVSFLAAAATAQAQDVPQFDARLVSHAQIPAQTFLAPPSDAPASLNVSGRFAAGPRTETLYDVVTGSTGLARPFPGQPLQGFSGIRSLGEDRFLVLTDNGFGSKANSSDAMLMFNILKPDWETGRVAIEETVFLSDPNRVVPFPITNEHSESRYLTGADFDLESIQPVGEHYWIGDEFGPWLFEVDGDGVVQQVFATEPGGELLRAPDNFFVRTPNPGGTLPDDVRTFSSGGYEGMALDEDGTTLYPMLEKPIWMPEEGASETIDGTPVLRIFEFDTASGTWGDSVRYYPLEDASHAIGDFNIIGGTRALIIERDGRQGDPRVEGFDEPAQFKRIYLVDLERADENGVLEKIGYIDLMDIQDPDGIAPRGTIEGRFNFPFVTIEDVDRVDETTIVVANDNNYPGSAGRELGRADDNEFILLEVADFLAAE
ncbi:esterase-like activity of phytase family protein [Pelagibacterium xiamenense]|uniref:esterase-like activity of phytase family protein n=1 Tax=Pelagibacterium xiamenense TaxID=2901140 RepID=UPI001E4AB0F5|nr:esterase-like activity of phytase family protein [Pelagibacterium xiamenense]MCD7061470.1 esterase-like activity of phytase family protein [Pelagibacterium xiamenense]